MHKLSSLSIRTHMLMIVIMMSLVTLGITLYSWRDQRNDDIREAKGVAARLVYQISVEQNTLTASGEQLLDTLSQLSIVQQRNKAAVNTLLGNIKKIHPQYAVLSMIDASGVVWASSAPLDNSISYANRRNFIHAVSSRRFSSGEYVIGKRLNKPLLAFGAPIRDSAGELTGIATIALNFDLYPNLLKMMKYPVGSSILFLDHQGTILYSTRDPQLTGQRDREDIFRRMSEGPDAGTFKSKGISGARQIVAYRKLRLQGEQAPYMYVLTRIPFDAALIGTNQEHVYNLFFLSALMLLALVFTLYISKRCIIYKIDELQDAAQRIAQGALDTRVSERVSGGELGELGRAFDSMAEALARDIAERNHAEMKLFEHSQRLKLATASGQLGIWDWDIEADVMLWDDRMFEIHGISRDKFTGSLKAWQNGVHRDDCEMALAAIKSAIHGVKEFNTEYRVVQPDGAVKYIKADGIVIRDMGGKALRMIGINRDVSEQKRSIKALVAAETRYRNLLESVQLVAVMLDCDGAITFCNNYFAGLTGWSRHELVGRNFFDLFIPDDVRARAKSVYGSYIERKTLRHYEGAIVTRNGARRLIVWNNVFLWDAEGNITGVASIGTDVSEHRHLEEQLRQSQKMEAIGTLAGGIAHDFNNILTVIAGYAYLAMEALDGKSKPMAAEIISSVNRAEEMTKSLLSFSRKQTLALAPADLNGIIRGLSRSLSRLIREDIEIRIELSDEQLPSMVDTGQIEQVIMNLTVNARDAMPAGGMLVISTNEVVIAGEDVGMVTVVKPGRYGLVAVTDNGLGMDRKTQERIFEPFFTTKTVGRGTGLGLSMVYGAIDKHGGYITVYSEPGQGTTFKIYLPLLDVPLQNASPEDDEALPMGDETILLVEDDKTIRHMTRALLERSGYRVLMAVDGEDALSVFRDNQDAIRLIVTDVIMPRKNGREAVEEINKIRSGIPVIFMSGYSADILTRRGIAEDSVNYLSKPLKPMVLLKKIRSLLAP